MEGKNRGEGEIIDKCQPPPPAGGWFIPGGEEMEPRKRVRDWDNALLGKEMRLRTGYGL